MSCSTCASLNEKEFTAEMMIHRPGFQHIADPGVLVFPKVLVCMDCGSSRFTTTEDELRSLGQRIAGSVSVVA
jgi:hypothetical protein